MCLVQLAGIFLKGSWFDLWQFFWFNTKNFTQRWIWAQYSSCSMPYEPPFYYFSFCSFPFPKWPTFCLLLLFFPTVKFQNYPNQWTIYNTTFINQSELHMAYAGQILFPLFQIKFCFLYLLLAFPIPCNFSALKCWRPSQHLILTADLRAIL